MPHVAVRQALERANAALEALLALPGLGLSPEGERFLTDRLIGIAKVQVETARAELPTTEQGGIRHAS
jgi:uncharacterized protein (UPF0262 family)